MNLYQLLLTSVMIVLRLLASLLAVLFSYLVNSMFTNGCTPTGLIEPS